MQSSTTVVTCYYRFPSKHSFIEYKTWITNFLTTVKSNLVVFCDTECYDELVSIRKFVGNDAFSRTKFIIKPLRQMMCASNKYLEYWSNDINRDHEKKLHNPNLYVVWNEKTNLVHEVIQTNPFENEYFCWCDIGCFRTTEGLSKLEKFPNNSKMATIDKSRMYLLNIEPYNENEIEIFKSIRIKETKLCNPFKYTSRIGGTIFLGHVNAWKTWIPAYYNTMDQFMENDLFTGKDQSIMSAVALLYPEIVQLIKPVPGKGDPWFYLQQYFS